MIDIVNAAGETLQLGGGQHLTIERLASWLTDDDLPGDYSYPITVPLNEANRRFVAQSYRPDAARPRYSMPITLLFSDILYRHCTMVYSVKNAKLSVVLHIDGGEVASQLAKKNLIDVFNPAWLKLGDELDLSGQTPKRSPAQCMLEIAQKPVGTHPFTFFPIRNEAFWEDSLNSSKIEGYAVRTYVNSWEKLASGQPGFRLDGEGAFGFVAVPQFYLAWVLQQIMALAGYRIESSWLARPEIQRLTILNMTGLIPPFLISGHYIPVGMCLPDMSVADFLKAIKGRFGLVFSYNANERVCQIAQFSSSVNAGPAIDLTPYQSGAYDTDRPRDTGFTLSEFLDENDQQYRDVDGKQIKPNSVSLGKGEEPISLRCGTTQQTYADSPLSTGQWLVPTVRIAGNTFDPRFAQSERFIKENKRPSAIGLQLLSYYGMQPDSTGSLYPFASPDVRNARQEVIGTQALTLRGRYGAWRQYLRPYYFFRDQSIPVTQPLLLPVAILSKLQMQRTVGLTLSRSVINSYLPVKLQADTPGPDGRALVRLECQTLPNGIGLPADVDEPLVWLELLQETERSSFTVELLEEKTKLTLKAWANKERTAPASISSLPIGIRMKRTYNLLDLASYVPPAKVQEYVQAYTLVSNLQIVETGLVTRLSRTELPANMLEDWQTSVQLDPGDGYYVLL